MHGCKRKQISQSTLISVSDNAIESLFFIISWPVPDQCFFKLPLPFLSHLCTQNTNRTQHFVLHFFKACYTNIM